MHRSRINRTAWFLIAPFLLVSAFQSGAAAQAAGVKNIVLVHGAWGGGWDWKTVDHLLTADGHTVYRATLTGRAFFPQLISAPFRSGLHEAFAFAIAACVIAAGASIVNDVSGLRDPALAGVCARTGAALVLMHTRAAPKQRLQDPDRYDDVLAEAVKRFQARHGLAMTGTVTPRTLAALNGSAAQHRRRLAGLLGLRAPAGDHSA